MIVVAAYFRRPLSPPHTHPRGYEAYGFMFSLILHQPLNSFGTELHPLDDHPLSLHLRDTLRWQWVLFSDWPGSLPAAACALLPWFRPMQFYPRSICLGCQLGGGGGKYMLRFHSFSQWGGGNGIHPAATPLSSRWHKTNTIPANTQP